MDWQFSDGRPIYTQLVEGLQLAIVTGLYPPGTKLPGVRELAADAGVNPNTMQRALSELENSGLVQAQRTSGRFVTDDTARIKALRKTLADARVDEFIRSMRALGYTLPAIRGMLDTVEEE